MKKIFKVLIFLLLIGMSIALLFIGNGYNMYKEAIENMPLEEKVEEIKRKENYAEFSELPQMMVSIILTLCLIAQNFDNGYHFIYKILNFKYNI